MARAGAAHGEIQMTEGSLWKNILLFSIPLVFSQLLQVMFNMADVAVVGKFASDTALGSVGSTSTLVTLFTGFLIGMGNGVNVRVAQHLGAQHREETSRAVHTAFLLCLLAGVGIMALCLALGCVMAFSVLTLLTPVQQMIGASALMWLSPVIMPTLSRPSTCTRSKNFSLTKALMGAV